MYIYEEIPLIQQVVTGLAVTEAGTAVYGFFGVADDLRGINPKSATFGDYASIGTGIAGIVKTGIRKVATEGIETVIESAAESEVAAVAGGNARLRYMGSTPDKFSRTGREVVDRMRGDGLIVGEGPLLRGNPNDLQLVTEGGQLVRIDSTIDMAHTVDAVSWWNSTGRIYGAKSPEVRQFMLDSDNYMLQL